MLELTRRRAAVVKF